MGWCEKTGYWGGGEVGKARSPRGAEKHKRENRGQTQPRRCSKCKGRRRCGDSFKTENLLESARVVLMLFKDNTAL